MGAFKTFAKGTALSMVLNRMLGRRARRRFSPPMPLGYGSSAIAGSVAMWAVNRYLQKRNAAGTQQAAR